MMTFAQVHTEVRKIAMGAYFSVSVESTESNGETAIEWSIYIAGMSDRSWSNCYPTPEQALDEMRAKAAGTWGDAKPATQEDLDAVGAVSAEELS